MVGASRFNGEGCFTDGRGFIFKCGGRPSFNGGVFEKTRRMGGGSPPLWKTLSIEINNNYSVYIVFDSESVLRKSKESNNYGIKVQVKRALLLKNILFCH